MRKHNFTLLLRSVEALASPDRSVKCKGNYVKLSVILILSFVVGTSLAFGEDKPPCAPIPIISESQAICYGKYHARVISEISKYGYKYDADRKGGNWRVRIKDQAPKKSLWIIIIRSNDGSFIEMKKSKT